MSKTLDVVAGNIIDDAWGNEIRDRTLQVFATAAERDSQWATAPDGSTCITVDTYARWIRRAGAWEPMWPRVVGYANPAAPGGTFGSTAVDVTGATVSVPLYPGHRYQIFGQICVLNQAAGNTVFNIYITDAANTIITGPANHAAPGFYSTLVAVGAAIPTVATSFKLRCASSAGNGAHAVSPFISVVDYGPAGT